MKKSKNKQKPKVHNELDGFDIKVNSSGEIESTYSIDELNKFLNKNVEDKKLKGRDDIEK
ncbi:hypothetical protein [Chondrinema litorale]|uniref:hypothetical protein n=1 Tax=Chondrinema litorale TaxID=2994555 RepID=UPI000C4CE3F5|nr:hypothetical protein [Chondrinema litorale]MBT33707.1 hypothetical protein [Thalassovita sp.]UZR93793.1 hypothetical protein OQ292_18255 [Chondrinema litorale]|tara:strand:+ start:158 stop:337 length:180 start_codon:yes stop_codon:yes gene_type:complete